MTGVGGEGADLVAFEEFDVSFLLSGDDVVDEHRTLSGDGFVHCGSTCFSDDEMMAGKELGHFFGPAFDGDPAGELVFDFTGFFVKSAKVSSKDDGDFGVVFKDGANDVADMG